MASSGSLGKPAAAGLESFGQRSSSFVEQEETLVAEALRSRALEPLLVRYPSKAQEPLISA